MSPFSGNLRRWAVVVVWSLSAAVCSATEPVTPDVEPQTWTAQDSLQPIADQSDDANDCLAGLCWQPEDFEVVNREPLSQHGDRLIQFPSPVASSDAINDLVSLEWYLARDDAGTPVEAPAIVVVHESGSSMHVGRLFAVSLRKMGFHTFLIHLPYYGHRRHPDQQRGAHQISAMRQAIADVRRARDAVAVLPHVDERTIALQGTSLGGFVSASSASLDGRYDAVFLMLAGGDLHDIIMHGEKDAAKVRQKLKEHGLVDEKLKSAVQRVEPTRIAHRIAPGRTWLYSGVYDKVVPQRNSELLAKTMQLPGSHHIRMMANHYSGVIYLPLIFSHIHDQIQRIHTDQVEQKK